MKFGGENASNYANADFDRQFERMREMESGPERQAIVDQMVETLRRDAPWVWGLHPKDYSLAHQWVYNRKSNKMANNGLKYQRDRSGAPRKIAEGVEPAGGVAAAGRAGRAAACYPAGGDRVSAPGTLGGADPGARSALIVLAYLVRRILYAIPILIGVNLITFVLFFFVNSPDDMARMQLGQKRVTPGGDSEVEGGARLRQADAVRRQGARHQEADRHHLLREIRQHVLVRVRARR